jgi:VWFA-related protein
MPDCRPRSFRSRFLPRLFRLVAGSANLRPAFCFAVAALLLLTAAPLSSQEKPGISVEVKVVNVLATVRDKHGELVSNLGKDDFVLEEDGRTQAITYFSHETDLPLALGLLVDTSGSQRRVLSEERTASRGFLDNMVREGQDKAFIIHFDREVELLQDLTTSHEKLESALDLVEIEQPDNDPSSGGPGGGQPGGYPPRARGGTALYDAIFLASDEVLRKQQGRKAIIVFSEGVDHGSRETLESATATAQRADTIVYSIYFADEEPFQSGFGRPGGGYGGRRRGTYPQPFPEERPDGKKILAQISAETGGRLFEASRKQPMDQIYRQIEEELRSQYSLGYTPDPNTETGYHKLHLTAKQKDMVVQARQGYYLNR